jgi:hypothetical protein
MHTNACLCAQWHMCASGVFMLADVHAGMPLPCTCFKPAHVLHAPCHQDCCVRIEAPEKPNGPFVFQICEPDGDLLLRLAADSSGIALSWCRSLAAAGLRVSGWEGLPPSSSSSSSRGAHHHPLATNTAAAAAAAAGNHSSGSLDTVPSSSSSSAGLAAYGRYPQQLLLRGLRGAAAGAVSVRNSVLARTMNWNASPNAAAARRPPQAPSRQQRRKGKAQQQQLQQQHREQEEQEEQQQQQQQQQQCEPYFAFAAAHLGGGGSNRIGRSSSTGMLRLTSISRHGSSCACAHVGPSTTHLLPICQRTHLYTHTHIHMYTHTCTNTHMYTHTCTHICTHTHVHTHVHTHMYTHMYTHVQCCLQVGQRRHW